MTSVTETNKDRVFIFDTTLRDGEQSPGATMTLEEKLQVAEALDDMGVDIIEAGFPIASNGDFEAVAEVAKRSKNAIIAGLARAIPADIARAAEAVRHARQGRIHTFVSTSPIHLAHQMKKTEDIYKDVHVTPPQLRAQTIPIPLLNATGRDVPAIRPATAADIPAVVALIDAAYAHYVPIIGRRPRPMDDDQAARIARGELFVLEEGERLLGVLTMIAGPDAMHIFNLAVAPEAQGRGLLRHLIGYAETVARARALPKLTLFTNVAMTRNRAIYAHLGFTELREEEGAGYRIVFMERPVAP